MSKQTPEALYQHLLYKYSHVGCPAARYEDNCDRPGACAENGRCLDLAETPFTRQFKKDCDALHDRLRAGDVVGTPQDTEQ